jgi:hypothetical protein
MPRNKKYWKRRFGNVENIPEYNHHLDFRRITDLDDEGFAYLLTNVKGVNMLDLNETDITNNSITLLTKLEYVYELRIKGCTEIDDHCIADLNKMTGLKFLHVKNTGITIDGLLKLNDLTNLTELMFSVDDETIIKDKMLLLKNNLPDCSFTVNSKPYIFAEE